MRIVVTGFFAALAAAQGFPPPPITGAARVTWIAGNTIGPATLLAGGISAGWGTILDHPSEYGTRWDGFAKRYGMRLTGIAASSTMEAGLGKLWGEDPRYVRDEGSPFAHRVRHVILMTFVGDDRYGQPMPHYARFVAISGSNFLSNRWRADSEVDSCHAVERIGLGFLGRIAKNAYDEFWPDVKDRVLRRGR